MAKTIVLLRHGKAQERSEEIADGARTLTKAGQRALRAGLPRALSLLGERDLGSLAVWSSSATRTLQTAEEASAILGASVESRACLTDLDVDAFVEEAVSAPESCIVAVGHNPFMEDVFERLSGMSVRFTTGACAALKIAEDGLPARLLWFVQGPEVAPWKLLGKLESLLAKSQERVERRLEEFFADPDDAEALHGLRVSIRTARSLIGFAAPFQKKSQNKAMQADLRSVVVVTSRLRELDVLISQAERMDPPACELLEACRAQRAKERDRVLNRLRSKMAKRAVARCHDAAMCLEWREEVLRSGLDAERVQERFESIVGEVEDRIARTDLREPEPTHRLRKKAKAARYAAENVSGLPEEEAADAAEEMKRIQERLGELCDARVNADIIEEFPVDGLSIEAKRDLEILRARNLEYVRSYPFDEMGDWDREPDDSSDEAALDAMERRASDGNSLT